MIQKYLTATFVLLVLASNLFAQRPYIENGSVTEQLNYVQEKSSRWENYTMIPDPWLTILKKNVLDTLKAKNEEFAELQNTLKQKENELASSTKELTATQNQLAKTEAEKNNFTILNIDLSKSLFLSIIATTFIILLVITAGALLLFKKENMAIKKSKNEHEQLKQEFEEYRQEVRVRQEQLVIQHHKEIQKLKGMG